MPNIFLSPSLQTGNTYITGGTEAQYMGYLADALEPYLTQNNIQYTRSSLPSTLAQAIARSNAGNYDLHLALHSNASPEGQSGRYRGIQAYYYPTSQSGKAAAEALVDALKAIYPLPDLVYIVPTTTIAEVRRTRAPAVLMEIGYHDNSEDAKWILDNIQNIARQLAVGLTDYFGLPFREVCGSPGNKITPAYPVGTYATACTGNGSFLNIRASNNVASTAVGRIPDGEIALVLQGPQNGWVRVRYNAVEGYVSADFLCACSSGQGASTATVNTDGSNLNLRARPSFNAAVLARIPDGGVVELLRPADEWYYVRWQGIAGYVYSQFLLL